MMALLETYSLFAKRNQYTDEPNPGPSLSSRNELGVKAKRKETRVSKKPVSRPSGENQNFRRIASLLFLYNARLVTKSINQ